MSSRTAISPKPPGPGIQQTLSRADRARRSGDLAAATRAYRDVLARFPANLRARKALAAIGPAAAAELSAKATSCQTARQLDTAEKYWADAVALCPDHAGYGLSLSRCRSELGRHQSALDAVNTVLKHQPKNALALDVKGCVLRDLGQVEAAEACHHAALAHGQDDAGPLNNLGILSRACGNTAAAASYFRKAIMARPDNASLHHNLAGCMTYRAGDAHIRQMQDQLASGSKNDPQQAPLHFALFKALDDIGDRDAAFAHLLLGNRLRKAASNFDIAREAYRFAWYKSLFQDAPDPVSTDTAIDTRPIFVVGLPRSGTTLVERILGQTPGARTAGELSIVSNAVAPLLRTLQADERAAPNPQDLSELRHRLLDGIGCHSHGAPVLIDKMPLNFRWAGLICAALPEARIVSLNRAPMPVAWSLYRHLFSSQGNGFAYDMGDIAAYLLLHRDMMQFWSTRFADQIVSFDYSALVTKTEQSIRGLVDACGLAWTDACLTPQTARGAVLTASAAQVRRGIYGNSDQDWRRYETHLSPLAAALKTMNLT